MTKNISQNVVWKALPKVLALVLILLSASLLLYCWHLSDQIEKRFSGRRWSIPSKVFSDITILYPGQSINRSFFRETLSRLGYWEVSNQPEQKGEMRTSGSLVELFLHDLEIPSRKREGFPVRIKFLDNRIDSIKHLKTSKPIPILELEPEEIALFFGPERERRRLISIDQVAKYVIHAILAAEDRRFYEHWGLDPWGILRALYINLRHFAILQGGSTITQQLAKNYFLTPQRTLSRKLKELCISITMEFLYEKDEILEIYLNEIYLGQKGTTSINGLGEASYFYFGKAVSDLTLSEAATIAGLIRGPNYYSPYIDEKRSQDRRNLVLVGMHKEGWISDEELRIATASPLNAVGFRDYDKKASYFIDYLSEQLRILYPPEALSSLGLSIYTTLDMQVQMAAEKALRRGLERLERSDSRLSRADPLNKLQGAIIVMQPKTGYVLALVGGCNYNVSQFNRATQARRQPGSAFKPFVYLSALERFTPISILSNEERSYEVDGKQWQPHNYETIPEDRVSLRDGLARSINLATVDLAMQIGLDRVVNTASSFRFSTLFKPYPSLSLGAFEVIPLELARAYCAFASDGVLPYPLSLKDVVDENGKVLERRHISIERVTSPAKAFIISSMLRSAVTEGTAKSLKEMGITFPSAGKTGTTNDFRDGWFVGYTPDILALIWVGFDNEDSIHASGSSAALPIWADLMNAIPHVISGDWFTIPPGVVKRTLCSQSGKLAVKYGCPHTREEFFLVGKEPTEYCPVHRRNDPLKRFFREVRDFFKRP